MDEATRLARAAEMGFDTGAPFFHGTNRNIEGGFRPSGSGALGPGVYMARKPETTRVYSGTPRRWDGGRPVDVDHSRGGNTLPLYVRGRIATRSDWVAAHERANKKLGARASLNDVNREASEDLQRQGFTGVGDETLDYYAMFDPANIRSKFAQFDPLQDGSSNLMAGFGGIGLLGFAGAGNARD